MKTLLQLLVLAVAAVSAANADSHPPAPAAKRLVNQTRDGLAIQGYDAVAYFAENRAVRGEPKFTATHDGVTYRFASAANRDLFVANPTRYVPAYGGYCGYAASIDRLSPIDPNVFQVIDGRLILQHNKKALDRWNADLAGNLVKADANWPGLVQRNGVTGGLLLNLDRKGVAIDGYDPVSYFVDGQPVKGRSEFEATYNGALYHFASAEHRETFEKNPARYVPAYGGFCGYAASIGKVRPIDPQLWSIVDEQLILQHSKGAVELWEKDIPGNKAKADRLWPRLIEAKAGKKDPIDSLLGRSVLTDVR
jgi:YHS domain-containing protein